LPQIRTRPLRRNLPIRADRGFTRTLQLPSPICANVGLTRRILRLTENFKKTPELDGAVCDRV